VRLWGCIILDKGVYRAVFMASIMGFRMQQPEELKEGGLCGGFPWGEGSVVRSASMWQDIRGSSFIATRATIAIALHLYILIHLLANATVSLGSNYPHDL
jgi:hypothetical protein